MRLSFRWALLIALFCLGSVVPGKAQFTLSSVPGGDLAMTDFSADLDGKPKKKKKKKKKKKSDEKDDEQELKFKDRLWYGGGLNLGFNSFYGTSVFGIGVSPMVGYKIVGPLSAGPRVSVYFTSFKERGVKALGLFNWETGLFVRSKIWGPIFAHGEIGNEWIQYPGNELDPVSFRRSKETYTRFNQYLGLGYNSADGGAGYEILVLYNFAVAQEVNTDENPFGLRIGLTFKF